MNDTYKIRNVGGSLMVVLPQKLARAMEISAGDEVVISPFDTDARQRLTTVIIKAVKKPKGKSR